MQENIEINTGSQEPTGTERADGAGETGDTQRERHHPRWMTWLMKSVISGWGEGMQCFDKVLLMDTDPVNLI